MKKVLSFVLTLAMVLGMVSMAFAGTYTDVKNTGYETAVTALSDLGVINGFEDGTYRPEGIVTRAQMAKLIIAAYGFEPTGKVETGFTDVPATHWAAAFVKYAADLGIVNGYPDGTFKPENTVSYNEALIMALRALGYNDTCLNNGTYSLAKYVLKANELGLLKVVDASTEGATRGDIAKLLYKAITLPLGKVNNDGTWVANRVTSDGAATLFANLAAGYTISEGQTIKLADAEKYGLYDYLGRNVDLYKKGDVAIVNGVNSTTIEAKLEKLAKTKDIDLDNLDTTAKLAGYKFDDDVKIAAGCDWINYVQQTVGETAYIADLTGNVCTWEVETKGNYITAIYSVNYLDATATYIMNKAGIDKIADDDAIGGKTFATDKYEEEYNYDAFILNGVEKVEDIKEGDVVTIYVSGSKIIRCDVCRDTVEGNVSKKSADSKTITVNGTQYKGFKPANNVKDLTVLSGETFGLTANENEYKFYLAANGKIVAYKLVEEEAEERTTETAIVLAVDELKVAKDLFGKEASEYYAKLFTTEGKEEVVQLTSKAIFTALETGLGTGNKNIIDYQLDEDGILDTYAFYANANEYVADKDITAKGVINGVQIAKDAIIILSEETKPGTEVAEVTTTAASLAVITRAKVLGREDVYANYWVEDKMITFMVIYESDVEEDAGYDLMAANDNYTSMIKDANGYVYEVEFFSATYKTKLAPSNYNVGNKLYKLTLDENGGLKAASVASYITDGKVDLTTVAAITENTLTIDDGEVSGTDITVLVDDDVVVFFYDAEEGEWTEATLDVLEDEDNVLTTPMTVEFYDVLGDKDGLIDYILIY